MKDLPPEKDEIKTFAHQVAFYEAMSESVFQLCLSCLVLREFGISTNPTEKFLQITRSLMPFLSIMLAFSKVIYS